MRITGGIHCGRTIAAPKSDAIRPTQDRVREALFNIVQCELAGADFLDLFAGSGAVGLEALSRGARSATFIEQNRRHAAVLRENLAHLCSSSSPDSFPAGRPGVGPYQAGAGSFPAGRPGVGPYQAGAGSFPAGRPGVGPYQAGAGSSSAGRPGVGPCQAGPIIVADCYRWIATYSGPGFSMAFADPPYALGEEKGYASVLKTLADRGVVRPGGLFIAEMTAVQKSEETPGWEMLRDRTYGKTRLVIWRRSEA